MSAELVEQYQEILPLETHCPLCRRPSSRSDATSEHIIPAWLQTRLSLRDRLLTLPNGRRRHYRSVRVDICSACNNQRFSQLENRLTRIWDRCACDESSFYDASFEIADDDVAAWLGKMFWLLARLGFETPDPTTRNAECVDTVVPQDLMPFMTWLGLYVASYALEKRALSCYSDDTADPANYGRSYSLYRFRIDDQGQPIERFNLIDHYLSMGIAMRLGDLGLVCLYDDELHARWRSAYYADLSSTWVHSVQFSEIVARMFYDQLMLHPLARDFTPFWNSSLDAVITCNGFKRGADPYWGLSDDPDLYADMLNRVMPDGTHAQIERVGDQFTTFLRDRAGNLWDVVNNCPRSTA